MKTILDGLIKGDTPFLKDSGFKKKHHTCVKSDGKDSVINFHLSKFNNGQFVVANVVNDQD